MLTIKDGKGNGHKARVNSDNELVITSLSRTPLEVASKKGNAYFWNTDEFTATTGGETVLLVRNNKAEPLYLSHMTLSASSGAGSFTIHKASVFTNLSGNSITGYQTIVSTNSTSTGIEAFYDETTNSQGNVITNIELAQGETIVVNLRGLSITKGESL